ncbi:MAG: carbon storage regulator CsrA [Pseudomonadota bacterium]
MLILSRNTDESLHIGDDIVVKVLQVRGNIVKLGIVAPQDVDIFRDEIYRQRTQGRPNGNAH